MARGKLRIYLGAAPGVGKTYAMLNEGWRGHQRGKDIVVGFYETHGRARTQEQLRDLEVIPRKPITHRGREFTEMDIDALLARKPHLALVDELAHTNVPGSRNEKRWQDVEELLDAGIDVVSTLNIQHLESVNDVVERITGIKQHETIPDEIVRSAEQVELVDMTPEALRRRMAHGNIYASDRVDASLANYFRPGNLAALREIALLWVADRVEENLHDYLEEHGIVDAWETRERVVVALTGAPGGDVLIRRASRMARRARGDLIGVHVRPTDGLAGPPSELLTHHRQLLADVGGTYHELAATDPGEALVQFAKAERATQLVLGSSRRSRWAELTHGSVISKVLRDAGPLDVHVISTADTHEEPTPLVHRRPSAISMRRVWLSLLLAAVALPLLTIVLGELRAEFKLPSVLLVYLLVVVAVATIGGFVPAVIAAVAAFLLANWYFTPPFYTFTIAERDNLIALCAFVIVGAVVGVLVSRISRRGTEASIAAAEAETLAQLSATLLTEDDPLPEIMAHLRSSFGCASIAVLRQEGKEWVVETSAGAPIPERPEDAQLSVPLDGQTTLVLAGPGFGPEDLPVLEAFTGQLALAVERRRLRAEAAMAEDLTEANELRTALLAAVSHDLRTPLASIKAAVSGLLQSDVEWNLVSIHELLRTIDDETDRLNTLVGNLLDMSRIQTGAIDQVRQEVGLEEVVPRALTGLGEDARVEVEIPETLPRVKADPALLERAVANLVSNALAWSPPEQVVRVTAGEVLDRVDLRIVDHGPGIPADQREQIFLPFQRMGDRPNGNGVGLGLAVAKGFVDAMDGALIVEDTPGGGTTMVVSLPAT